MLGVLSVKEAYIEFFLGKFVPGSNWYTTNIQFHTLDLESACNVFLHLSGENWISSCLFMGILNA